MRKVLLRIVTFLVLAAALVCLVVGGKWFLEENYVFMDGTLHRRDAQTLDLSGRSVEELEKLKEFPNLEQLDVRGTGLTTEAYEWLCRELPGCAVFWDVPFQGGYYSEDTQALTVMSLTEADIAQLDYFPNLACINAMECRDYSQLLALQQRRPECRVDYAVPLAGESWSSDAAELKLRDADGAELLKMLCYLPKVERVHLTGVLPEMEELEVLREVYPQIAFTWQVQLGEGAMDRDTAWLDMFGMHFDSVEDAAKTLSYFTKLEQVDMRDCGLSDAEMMALADRFPDTDFLWNLTIAGLTVRTDVQEIDLSGREIGSTAAIEALLPYLYELEKVVMCGCGIESPDMAVLSERHPEIRFVWSVDLAGMLFRTDSTYFMPNKYGLECTDENIYDLRYCVDMLCVDVGHMQDVTNCEWAAFMPKLRYLVLADSGVGDITPLTGLTRLVFLELFQSKVRDYSPLVTCTALEDLNLCYTFGDPEPIGQMTWLKRVWWSGWWAGRAKLPQMLPNTQLEFDTVSSTGAGWREGQNYYDMRDLVGMGYMTG